MAAPTSAVQKLQKILANVGPSTHGLDFLLFRYFEPAMGEALPDGALTASHILLWLRA